MRTPLRLVGGVALIVLFYAGAYALLPSLLADWGLNPRQWAAWRARFDDQWPREQELERGLRHAAAYADAQRRICRDLAEGRLTLPEAARRLDELPGPPEHFRELIRVGFPGATDDERMCQRAITLACELLHEESDAQEALRQRLERELDALLNGSDRATKSGR